MQSERKHTKYLKANDNGDQLRRALNNLIKSALGGEHKLVVALAEALIILNSNTVPSARDRDYFVAIPRKGIGQNQCRNRRRNDIKFLRLVEECNGHKM
jgi:hypothetical protein